MEINPQAVRGAAFKTVRKGADPDEVRVFLNDVADELERAQNQSTAMEARARAAVARLQELTETGASAPAATVDASVDESETISRTLLLAQRTADTTVAEARGEAARIVRAANDEAATTLDSTREMVAQLLDEARTEARKTGEAERTAMASAVEALKARRDFLESDVEQLELFLTEQRNRLREAATSLIDITERVPGGLGEVRAPLLSASDDEPSGAFAATGSVAALESDEEVLRIVTEIAQSETVAASEGTDPWTDSSAEPTTAMATVDTSEATDDDADGDSSDRSGNEAGNDTDNDFRFSFEDDRR